MLPYTPLHHLLLADGPPVLVMTSGNVSDEPIARDDATALDRLSGIADAFLLHDREIHARADDSVVRVLGESVQPVRRSRGFAPDPIALPFSARPCWRSAPSSRTRSGHARRRGVPLSARGRPRGPGKRSASRGGHREARTAPGRLSDGHRPRPPPDYGSTRWHDGRISRSWRCSTITRTSPPALRRTAGACPTIGVAFDGTGCGPAGDLWGGEILLADLGGFRRLGHLRPIALAGGEAAIRQPWRLAAAALADAGESLSALPGIAPERRNAVRRLLDKRFASPLATGAGRWFDAVAALLGVRSEISYEVSGDRVEARLRATTGNPFVRFWFGCAARRDRLRPAVRAIVRARGRNEECGRSRRASRNALLRDSGSCRRPGRIRRLEPSLCRELGFQNRRLTQGRSPTRERRVRSPGPSRVRQRRGLASGRRPSRRGG